MPSSELNFHPQKLFPRYSRLAATSALSNFGFSAFRRALPFAWDQKNIESERLLPQYLGSTPLAIVGYPRTGTTFLQFALEREMNSRGQIFKNHDAFSIGNLSLRGIPVLIPVRNPRDTCISWSFYNKDKFSRKSALRRLASYLAWHRIAHRYIAHENVFPIPFDAFSQQLGFIPNNILQKLEISSSLEVSQTTGLMNDFHSIQNDLNLDLRVSNTPSAARQQATQSYKEIYDHLSGHRFMTKAKNLYEEFCLDFSKD